jgi:hypothetical protein
MEGELPMGAWDGGFRFALPTLLPHRGEFTTFPHRDEFTQLPHQGEFTALPHQGEFT